jgi:flagellar basal-body rod protein FlgB
MTLESSATKYLVAAMNARTLRQDMIAGNIANVDTPGYRPRDVDFESALSQAADKEINNATSNKLQLAKTNGAHLDPEDSLNVKPRVFFRDGHLARNDGTVLI